MHWKLKSVFSEIRVSKWISRQNNRPIIGRPDGLANQRLVSLAGNYLNSCLDTDLRKNWLYKKKSPTQIFHKMTIIISILLTLWYLCIKLPRNKYKFPCSSSFTDGVVYRKTWVSSRKKNFVSFPCQILNNWILLQLELG